MNSIRASQDALPQQQKELEQKLVRTPLPSTQDLLGTLQEHLKKHQDKEDDQVFMETAFSLQSLIAQELVNRTTNLLCTSFGDMCQSYEKFGNLVVNKKQHHTEFANVEYKKFTERLDVKVEQTLST